MNAVSKLPSHVVAGFMARVAAAGINPDRVHLLEPSTEELRDDLESGRRVTLHARNFSGRRPMLVQRPQNGGQQHQRGSSGKARLEENYFYSSRRFPTAVDNTIGSGAVVAGNFPLFNKGLGEDGSGLGFPTGFMLGQAETNLEVGGYLPQGTNFVASQLGVTFNSDVATADLAVFVDAAALNFSKSGGQFGMLHGPLKMWPSGMGIGGYAAAAVGGTPLAQTAAHNGAADIRAVRTLRIPRILREKEVFNYSIFITRTTKAKNGAAIALTDFVVATIWMWGGQKNSIPS
jgi:hypothetical protein